MSGLNLIESELAIKKILPLGHLIKEPKMSVAMKVTHNGKMLLILKSTAYVITDSSNRKLKIFLHKHGRT